MLSNYEKLELERIEIDGRRHYRTPLGLQPSVTTVLSNTKDIISRRRLDRWKSEVGQAHSESITDRGTATHELIEAYLLSGVLPTDIPENAAPYWASIAPELLRVTDVELLESSVYHPHGAAGSIDCLAKLDGVLSLLDWKTSAKVKKKEWLEDYKMQIAYYTGAVNWLYGCKITQGAVVIAVADRPAQVFVLDRDELIHYWFKFLDRLSEYYRLFPAIPKT